MTIIDETILKLLFEDKEAGNRKDHAINPISKWIVTAFPVQPSQASVFTVKGTS